MAHHLVTGGAGFIGSALCNRLVAEGHTVTAFDRFSRGKEGRLEQTVRTVRGDVRDLHATIAAATPHPDTVWHLAYVQGTQTFYADPALVIDVALTGIMNVLHVAQTRRPFDLVLVSSSEVYQNPPASYYPTDESVPLSVPDVRNPRYSYGGGKIASEIATLAYAQAGLLERAVIVRPHNIYGPDMGFAHVIPEFAVRMMELQPRHGGAAGSDPLPFPIQGTGGESRSFCYIDDCVDGLMLLLEKGKDRNVYHLGNPAEEYTIRLLAEHVAWWFGREIEVVPGKLPEGSPRRRKPDISKMRELGFDPFVMLPNGLERTLPWYVENARLTA